MEKKMEVMKGKEEKKLSYEQLNNLAVQLSEQNKKLYTEVMQLREQLQFVNLDFYFRIVESDKFPEEFVNKIKENIIKAFTEEEKENK